MKTEEPPMRDPKTQGPEPEYPQPPIDPPGTEAEMTPKADHGETSYRGSGRLTDHVALIVAPSVADGLAASVSRPFS